MSQDADQDADQVPDGAPAEASNESHDREEDEDEDEDENGSEGSVEPAPSPGTLHGAAVEIPPVEELTGDVQRLDRRVQVSWLLRAVVLSVVLGAIAAVAGEFAAVGIGPGIALGAITLVLGVAHAIARYRIWRFQVRPDALYLERGVLTRVKTVVPHVRIQHVDASRGPLERALGLSSVVVYTAGSRGADVTVPGLTRDRADDLQTRLKHLAIAAEGEDAV